MFYPGVFVGYSEVRLKKRIEVVCGVFFRGQGQSFEVAVFRRLDHGELYEFPGGKIDPGESDEVALQRELDEELNLNVEVLGILGENEHTYESAHVVLRAYWVRCGSWAKLRLNDHSSFLWVGDHWLIDAPDLLAPADIPLWRLIFEQGARPYC